MSNKIIEKTLESGMYNCPDCNRSFKVYEHDIQNELVLLMQKKKEPMFKRVFFVKCEYCPAKIYNISIGA